jgi:hypothetical protein
MEVAPILLDWERQLRDTEGKVHGRIAINRHSWHCARLELCDKRAVVIQKD